MVKVNLSRRRGVIALLVVVAVVVAGWGALRVIRAIEYRPGTPELSAELEAMRSSAVGYTEMRPIRGHGWTLVVDSVSKSGVWISFDYGEEGARDVRMDVGTSQVLAGCTVAVLETHPGPAGSGSGSQTGWALMAIECPETAADGSVSAAPGELSSVPPSASASATAAG